MSLNFESLKSKVQAGESIDRSEALSLYNSASDQELQQLACLSKSRFHDPKQATYLMMAIVNYTNICVAKCDYCAFYKLPHQEGGYLLTLPQLKERIDALIAFGGQLVGFNGGFHPDLRIDDYASLFSELRSVYKDRLDFYEMTVAEFMFTCKRSRMSYAQGAETLRSAGTRWITGGGAEVLDDAFRMRHSPGKYKVEDYYDAQRAILQAGIGSTATMVIGFDETLEERMNHLERLRSFQSEVGGALSSFLCWTYKPYGTEFGGQEISTKSYLRWLAVSRIYLDNFRHIRTSVLTKNEQALLGIDWGADDFDLPTEDEVTQKAGATVSHDFASILEYGAKRGFTIKKRKPFQPLAYCESADLLGDSALKSQVPSAGISSTNTSSAPAL